MKTDKTEWLPAWEDPDAPARRPASPPPSPPPPGGPHRWRRRLLIGGISFLALVVLLTGAGYV